MSCSNDAIFVVLAKQLCGLSNEVICRRYLVKVYFFCTFYMK